MPHKQSPDLGKYGALSTKCRELGLLKHPIVRAALRELKEGCLRKSEEEELIRTMIHRQQQLEEAGIVVTPPCADDLPQEGIFVGETVDPNGGVSVYNSHTPPRPCLFEGSSGYGKTHLQMIIIKESLGKYPIWIIDPRDDFTCLARLWPERTLVVDSHRFRQNIFCPDYGVPFEDNARAITSVIAEANMLFNRGQNLLLDAITAIHNSGLMPTVRRILSYLRSNKKKYEYDKSAYDSLLDRLLSIDLIYGDSWDVESGLQVSDICKYDLVVFRTQGLGLVTERIHFAALMLMRAFLYRRSKRERHNEPQLMIVLEEGEYLLSTQREKKLLSVSCITEMVHQARGIGLLLSLITQNPTAINSSFLNDAGNIYIFALRDGEARKSIGQSLGLGPDGWDHLGSLKEQFCYCRLNTGECRNAFLMKVRDYNLDETPLSDEELADNLQRHAHDLQFPLADGGTTPLEVNQLPDAPSEQEAVDTPDYKELPFEYRRFLYGIQTVGQRGLVPLYAHSVLSPTTGKKYLQRAMDEGLAGTLNLVLPGRGGNRTAVYLTLSGLELIGAPKPHGIGGDEHQAWQKSLAWSLEEQGLEISVEKSIKGKSIDLVHRFTNTQGKVQFNGIEIEISDPLRGAENAIKDLPVVHEIFLTVHLSECSRLQTDIENRFHGADKDRIHVIPLEEFVRAYLKYWEELPK